MKKNITYALASSLLALAAGACSADLPDAPDAPGTPATDGDTMLRLEIGMEDTRAIIESTQFSEGDEIAVVICDPAEGTVLEQNRATYRGGEWRLATPVNLAHSRFKDKSVTVGAVYPYDMVRRASVEDMQVVFDLGQHDPYTDFMTGYDKEVSMENPTARITFSHMMSRVTLKLANRSRYLQANVSDITFGNVANPQGFGFLGKVYKLGLSGAIVDTSGTGYTLAIPQKLTLNPSQEGVIDILLPPTHNIYEEWRKLVDEGQIPEGTNAGVKGVMTVNGIPVSFTIDTPDWTAGQQYTYPVTLQ